MESKKIRPVVMAFAEALEERLQENDHKGGWEMDTRGALFRRLIEETAELSDELMGFGPPNMKEALDVAAFAMMLWDNLHAKIGSRNASDQVDGRIDVDFDKNGNVQQATVTEDITCMVKKDKVNGEILYSGNMVCNVCRKIRPLSEFDGSLTCWYCRDAAGLIMK